jgi:DNA-binding MarR family transcriptional regulator
VGELAEPFLERMSLPAVTKHLKVLEKAGLVEKTRDAQRRPCQLKAEALKDAVEWMEQYRAFWEQSFDRLEEYLKTVTAQKKQADTKTTRSMKKKGKPNGPKQ